MNITEQINQYIAENGGSTRDALNIALAQIDSLIIEKAVLQAEISDFKKEANRWIPVSERLPVSEDDVQIVVEGWLSNDEWMTTGYKRLGYDNITLNKVVCWRPLPEPPGESIKEESNS